MKTLNITFDDAEYEKLAKVKNRMNLSWHAFILKLVDDKNGRR